MSKPLYEKLPPAKLYLDDVEKLYQTVQEGSAYVEIRAADEAFNSPGALTKLPIETLRDLEIRGFRKNYDAYFSIELTRSYVVLHSTTDDSLAQGVAAKARKILTPRRRRLVQLVTRIIASAGTYAALLILSIFMLPYALRPEQSFFGRPFKEYQNWVALTILLALLLGGFSMRFFSRGNLIIVKARKEAPSFWRRNRDQLVRDVFLIIASALATYLLTRM